MKNFLTTLHRWLGFPVGLLFVLSFGTGFLTSIDELVKRAKRPSLLDWHYHNQTPNEQAQAIDYLIAHYPDAGYIQLPRPDAPFYRVISRDGQMIHAMDNISVGISIPRYSNVFFDTALQLHRNLLLGRDNFTGINGAQIMAWSALLSLFLSLLGLYLWWPLRRKFKLRDSLPKSFKRKDVYFSHMTAGVITLVPIVMLALTGAAITYRDLAKKILGVQETTTQPAAPQQLDANWQAWLDAGYAAIPNGQLKAVQMPRQPQENRPERSNREPNNREPNNREPNNRDLNNEQKRFSVDMAQSANTDTTQKPRGEPQGQDKKRQNNRQGGEQNSAITLVFEGPGDWWGLANSRVTIDSQRAQLLQVNDFGKLSLGAKILSVLKPLHTGRELPVFYVGLLFLFSALGTVMVLSGLLSFIKKKRPWLASAAKRLQPKANA
jgi:uncharacterized iron-regulated membrane protein